MVGSGLFFAFAAAVTILMLIPGPNVGLIVANSVTFGARYGFITVAGTRSAMVIQLFVTALGMTEVLGALANWFEWLRWAGVIYLFYLGIVQWCAPATDLTKVPLEPKSPRAIYMRAFLVSLTNPKTLFFYSAFFPQFLRLDRPIGNQVAFLSITFLALAFLIDSGWVLAASGARGLLAHRGKIRNRISGSVLIGAGTALALVRNK